MKDRLVILFDFNSVSWMGIESNVENNLRVLDMIGISLDCLFIRYLQNQLVRHSLIAYDEN